MAVALPATDVGRWPSQASTRVVPRVLPLGLRLDRAVASGFRTVSQLNIGYRDSPAVEEGRPALRRGPKAGDRLPDARVVREGPGMLAR